MNHKQIKELIESTLKNMNMYSEDALELVFLTGLVESGYNYISQIGSGIARSFFQVEPATAFDSINSYLVYRDSKMERVADCMMIDPMALKSMDELELEELLWGNIYAGIIFCRLKYWRVPLRIPSDLDGKAKYWLKYYNAGGKGTINHFLEMAETRKD
ncbi:MAG TPA: hypothetical protein EYF95_04750 [Flavobacteriales bacterium]|nr:hypothetical protein [Flavobacteriales bacterium]HIK67257.1 hypothetical protein [Flavobacteriales bacterium]